MDYLGKGLPLMFGRLAHFRSDNQHQIIASEVRLSIERLFYITKLAIEADDLKLSHRCFALAHVLLHHGNHQIRLFTKLSFINTFGHFLTESDQKRQRLRFFVPADFYSLFLNPKITDTQRTVSKPEPEKATEDPIVYRLATEADLIYTEQICQEMHDSAIARGCGISKREPSQLIDKIMEGKAVIAINGDNQWVGFSYIEVYENGQYVSNSGLIVSPAYRKRGVAWEIKQRIFDLSRTIYPNAKIFSITTGSAVMKMNSKLGFEPVSYAEITKDSRFWEGCKSCVNHATLISKNCKNCFCTAMLFEPGQNNEG
ncbi:hypothetical protein LZD49_20415 [Dyadobacter sp. CY261]|uniref:hypothetical protein n=1 Tax=Dyadobacter sp. CY261 TaxID=2907203 RepID=UPI001F3F5C64|nr:hypothetical protein [Dyadobacter sp. CY261]MCF0072856.1 hypothetical protein [Dyadobacter sp. CY261]